jgi:hypothetical protein
MGRSTIGAIAFTPDGELGFVAQEDGSLGVFRMTDGGGVEVLHAAFEGDFYAEQVYVGGAGETVYVVDPNTRGNGGGIYQLRIRCDDAIEEVGQVVAASSPSMQLFNREGRTVMAARDIGGATAPGHDVHLLDSALARLGGVDAFGDDDAIVSGAAVTRDGRFALFGDSQGIVSTPNRIAVVESTATTITARQVLTPIEDPLSIVMSPFDDVALVVSGFGDAFFALDYAPAAATPFTLRGQITYTGARPELPGPAVMIESGALRGLVLVPENLGIRRLRFEGQGVVRDLGKTATGASGFENITGALGIQP